MRSSSDSIAQLASALAKAQIELVNPVKTMTGVIDRWGSGAVEPTARHQGSTPSTREGSTGAPAHTPTRGGRTARSD